jgi:serine/threonine protein kinase
MRSSVRRTLVAEVLPGRFGPYTLVSRLSSGGMAELFLAVRHSPVAFDKVVVVKRILPGRSLDPSFVDMFLHEARVAATLSHPNIVQTYEAGDIDGRCFIAMEHVHGEDAHAALGAAQQRGLSAVPLEHAVAIVLSACAGLTYVHEKCDTSGIPLGIIHRDVCTRNVVVSFAGDVKLVDFGIAKSDIDDGDERDETKVATLKGKIGYMSPEQVMGEALDVRTDIFALGVVLFELTTGARPFRGRSDVETMTMVRDAACPSPGALVAGYPPGLERVVMRALQKKREDRYPSMRQMQADLERFVRDENVAVSHAGLGAWMRALFEDQLGDHAEVLRSVPQVVESLAARDRRSPSDSGALVTQPFGPASVPPLAASVAPPPRWRLGALALGAAAVLGTVGAIVYVARGIQHEMELRTSLLRSYHEEQSVRPPPQDPPETTGALEVTSKPPGCAIWINGTLRPETTPATIDKMPLGRELHVKVATDGFEAYRTTLRLTDESPFKEIAAEMKALPATVVLHVEPTAGVNVWLDGKLWKGDHGTMDGLTPGVEHWILFASPGYVARMASVTPSPGETTTLTVRLLKSGKPAPAFTP